MELKKKKTWESPILVPMLNITRCFTFLVCFYLPHEFQWNFGAITFHQADMYTARLEDVQVTVMPTNHRYQNSLRPGPTATKSLSGKGESDLWSVLSAHTVPKVLLLCSLAVPHCPCRSLCTLHHTSCNAYYKLHPVPGPNAILLLTLVLQKFLTSSHFLIVDLPFNNNNNNNKVLLRKI